MKKVLSIVLALAIVLSLGVVALADSQTGNPENANQTMPANQQNTVNVVKTYKATNADTTSPAETVAFTFEKVSVADAADGITLEKMPNLVSVTLAAYAQGAATTEGSTSNLVITLPAYTGVGVYTYSITETDGNMAGVKYGANATPIKLVVTVTQGSSGLLEIAAIHTEGSGDTKSDTFTNEYSAGSLSVAKTVSGNMGDQSKYFDFTVTLTAPTGDTVGAPITISGGSHTSNPTTVATSDWNSSGVATISFKLKHGETLTFANIPYGVTYTVDEADYSSEKYTTTGEVDTATAINSAATTVTVNNEKKTTPDTGITLDSLPYVLMAVMAMFAAVVIILNKRRASDY
ncbi:MAG: hypothetical protein IKE62_03450 [Oscillospiraceae bacterium]|nr:hypothetical protein [Oscillospiraceae bacterium]